MRQLRLIDLLCLVVEKQLKDGQIVLINSICYKFDKKDERFYMTSCQSRYREIYTNDLRLKCYILEDYND